jgi:hypothetical protein
MTEVVFYTLRQVAEKLQKSERWLWGWLDEHPRDKFNRPFYRLAGRSKRFSAKQIEAIFEELPCPAPRAQRRGADVRREAAKSAAPMSEAALNRALELARR